MMCNYWANFIRCGDPNGFDADGSRMPVWEKFTPECDRAMYFGDGFVEYGREELVLLVSVPCANGPAAARRLLAFAHPDARFGAHVRACYLAKSGCAAFAVRLAATEVTMPALNAAFGALWRVAKEFGGAA